MNSLLFTTGEILRTVTPVPLENFIDKTKATINVQKLIIAGVIILIGIVIFWALRRFFRRYKKTTDPNLKQKRTVMLAIYSLLRFLVIVIVVLAILSLYGVNISGAVAGLGIAGAAGALAVQDLLKDMISGITIISEHYFALGDIVEYNGLVGKVVELTIRSTKIQSLKDGSVTSLQNHLLSEIKVHSHAVNLNIPLSYELPVGKAAEVMKSICTRAEENELIESCSFLGTNDFNDSSVSYLIQLHCDPFMQLPARRVVLGIVQEELEKAGLRIPYPQLDVHTDPEA